MPNAPTLIILPCGKRKIWDDYADAGTTPARDAYTGVRATLFAGGRAVPLHVLRMHHQHRSHAGAHDVLGH
jgi:hypothetical protein